MPFALEGFTTETYRRLMGLGGLRDSVRGFEANHQSRFRGDLKTSWIGQDLWEVDTFLKFEWS